MTFYTIITWFILVPINAIVSLTLPLGLNDSPEWKLWHNFRCPVPILIYIIIDLFLRYCTNDNSYSQNIIICAMIRFIIQFSFFDLIIGRVPLDVVESMGIAHISFLSAFIAILLSVEQVVWNGVNHFSIC